MFQGHLFGEPLEDLNPPSKLDLVVLDFETKAVRMIVIKGEPWWVLSDVARALGYKHVPHAARLLEDKHKGVHQMDTLGGKQNLTIVNEAGLYCLMMGSERPEAKRFRDWLFEDVLPSIRRTGSYSIAKPSRVEKIQKRLKSDRRTAEKRVEVIDWNKQSAARLSNAETPRSGYPAWYDALNRAQFNGKTAADLRRWLGLKGWQTPLDHMGEIPLSQRSHAICLAERKIHEAEAIQGRPLSLESQIEIVHETVRHVVASSFACLGPGHTFAIAEDRQRGKVLDVLLRLPAA